MTRITQRLETQTVDPGAQAAGVVDRTLGIGQVISQAGNALYAYGQEKARIHDADVTAQAQLEMRRILAEQETRANADDADIYNFEKQEEKFLQNAFNEISKKYKPLTAEANNRLQLDMQNQIITGKIRAKSLEVSAIKSRVKRTMQETLQANTETLFADPTQYGYLLESQKKQIEQFSRALNTEEEEALKVQAEEDLKRAYMTARLESDPLAIIQDIEQGELDDILPAQEQSKLKDLAFKKYKSDIEKAQFEDLLSIASTNKDLFDKIYTGQASIEDVLALQDGTNQSLINKATQALIKQKSKIRTTQEKQERFFELDTIEKRFTKSKNEIKFESDGLTKDDQVAFVIRYMQDVSESYAEGYLTASEAKTLNRRASVWLYNNVEDIGSTAFGRAFTENSADRMVFNYLDEFLDDTNIGDNKQIYKDSVINAVNILDSADANKINQKSEEEQEQYFRNISQRAIVNALNKLNPNITKPEQLGNIVYDTNGAPILKSKKVPPQSGLPAIKPIGAEFRVMINLSTGQRIRVQLDDAGNPMQDTIEVLSD